MCRPKADEEEDVPEQKQRDAAMVRVKEERCGGWRPLSI